MSVCGVTLVSADGVSVTVPGAIAWQQIGLLQGLAALDEGGTTEMPPVELDFPAAVVQGVVAYLVNPDRRVAEIPKPLTAPVDHFAKAWEMDFARDMERCDLLLPLLECSCYLRIDALHGLLAAFVAQRIEEISKAAPSIMEGAERVRQYLHLANEWTPEEMTHLEEEMRYAKEVDPGAY
ncbi:hypothetical protein DQ04_07401030 [Trypanosoma grayi]|uniref:hypothetical protein n=1 Tax=Trypanosoma grayi TaxID=71804 RepID=UPI0004F40FCD|nr:hypothetical protein DQ04_07401030 [Trypanosoma grayi]KEG08348.1 hypothetical protein DQ04_07401030 [Trypanosoma grayi]